MESENKNYILLSYGSIIIFVLAFFLIEFFTGYFTSLNMNTLVYNIMILVVSVLSSLVLDKLLMISGIIKKPSEFWLIHRKTIKTVIFLFAMSEVTDIIIYVFRKYS